MGASSSRNRRREGQGAYADPLGPPPQYQTQTAPLSFHPGQHGPPHYHPAAYSQSAQLPPGIGPHAHHPAGPRPPPSYYPANHAPAPVKNSVHNTSTVRNLVNLKKSTLAVASLEGRPHLKQVSFKFDATAPCYVSVLPMAQEEGREGRLTTKARLGPRVQYDKGWNLTFPPEGLADPELYCIDTSVYGGEQLHHANVSTHAYPLIIRIETLGEAAAAPGGEDVAAMPLGCAQPDWLQSQTTYAVLGEDAGGQVAKVVKQKIWVNGASYELQEIYGLMEASTGTGDGDTSTECVVCLTNPKNTTVIPCRHFCMCSDCAKALLNQSRKCPMCRLNITSVLQINIGASSRTPAGAKGAADAGARAGAPPAHPSGAKPLPLV